VKETKLAQAVNQLALVMQSLPDEVLGWDWTWGTQDEGVRFALLGTYHELRDLAVTLEAVRHAAGNPRTPAQHKLAQYHAAFRDLQAILSGVSDDDLDRPPAEGEWPLRDVLGHIIGADRRFFALVYYAVEQQRAGEEPSPVKAGQMDALVGPREAFEQTIDSSLADIFSYYVGLHGRILEEMGGINDKDLSAPSLFWEDNPQLVGYRLHRFDAHLRQHAVQAEKTLAAIGYAPNEAKRLLRLVYNALAEVEGITIGVKELGLEQQLEATAMIDARAAEIADLVSAD
jgi:hypothetical protein